MKYLIEIRKKYLRIPVDLTGQVKNVCFYVDGKKEGQYEIPLCCDEKKKSCDFYAEYPSEAWIGKTVELVTDDDASMTMLPEQSDELLERDQLEYPYIHFAPVSGWMNDPNGLCYYKGEYHLYFQHNMFADQWNNISWGHAVSKDLLHWTQLEDALLPDEEGMIFTGSAIQNSQGLLGCPEDALLVIYTSSGGKSRWSEGKKFVQKMAWSTDGRRFTKLPEVIIPYMINENRDPKIYWMEETKSYYLVMFLDGHQYAIFVSEDLKNWEQSQLLDIPESWECPDLFRLSTSDGKDKWVFWTADGFYLVGSFDGRTFVPEQKIRKTYGNKLPYAAQTLWGTEGRIVQIPWMTVKSQGKKYKGMMGIPRELELLERNGEYILLSHFAREVYQQEIIIAEDSIRGKEQYFWGEKGAVLLQLFECGNEGMESFSFTCGKFSLHWNAEKKTMQWMDQSAAEIPELHNFTMILDKEMVEINCNSDTLCFFYELEGVLAPEKEFLEIEANANMKLGVIK